MPICVPNQEIEEEICWREREGQDLTRVVPALKELLRLRKRVVGLMLDYSSARDELFTAEYKVRRLSNIALDLAGDVLEIDAKMDAILALNAEGEARYIAFEQRHAQRQRDLNDQGPSDEGLPENWQLEGCER